MRLPLAAVAAICVARSVAPASPITYQGFLNESGVPANGSYDMLFLLFDDLNPGLPDTIVSSAEVTGVTVTDGLFTAEIDLPEGSFDRRRPLPRDQCAAPAGGGGDYSTLSPRQRVGDTPNARHANFASGLRLPIDAYGTPTIMGGPVLSVTNLGLSGYAVRGEAPHGGVLGLGGDYAPTRPSTLPQASSASARASAPAAPAAPAPAFSGTPTRASAASSQ